MRIIDYEIVEERDEPICRGCAAGIVGVEPEDEAIAHKAEEKRITAGVLDAFRQITPRLILVAIATGASFAIGGWIAHRFILPKR